MAAIAFLFDIAGNRSSDPRIDLNELLLLGIIVGAGVAWFGWRRILEQEREIRSKTEAEQHARFLADHDHLTALPNRRVLQRELKAAMDHGEKVALFLLDLNGFKRVNDVFGHARGDEVLRAVATRLTKALPPKALIVRMSGDEFALVLRDFDGVAAALDLADALRAALADPIVLGTDEHAIGTGIGIAIAPDQGEAPGDLLRKADAALYRSKSQQGSPPTIFDDEMERETRERDLLQRELTLAVAAREIVPFYQPIVDLKTGRIRAFEALARWDNRRLGFVPPAVFIPLAEDANLICNLSDMLLDRACRDAVGWPQDIDLSFNVSPIMLREPTFALRILRILGATGLSPKRLELEVTETAIASDLDRASANLKVLKDMGLRIMLDDFGTGATTLAHLRAFKFDGIKIDRKFVDLMLIEGESAAIVRAMLGLASGLGMTIVAEGIEGIEQSTALQAEGCSTGQGYYFGRAVPAAEVDRLLLKDGGTTAFRLVGGRTV